MIINKIIEWSIRNPFLICVGVGGLAVLGYLSLLSTPLDAIPDISDPQIIVYTEWKGQDPIKIEDQITQPVVSGLLSVPGCKVVRGVSMFGSSFVYVILDDQTDYYWAKNRVMEYLQTIDLPNGVVPILGPDASGVGWGFEYALVDRSGNVSLSELRSLQDWKIRYWLEQVPGVADVASVGGFVKEYQVALLPDLMNRYRISLPQITMAIRKSNIDVSGRILELSGREYWIRGKGLIESTEDIEHITITQRDGAPIYVKDVAQVSIGPAIRRGMVDLNGEGEVVGGIVIVRFGENVLDVIDRVKAALTDHQHALPDGVEVIPTYDRSELIHHAVDNLLEKIMMELAIIAVLCILFLLHVRSAFVAVITLPLAVLIAFIGFYWMGLSSNIMSLGGIAIAMGAMIDASVVMVENAHKRLEEAGSGVLKSQIILESTKEMGRPLFFALLIITVSFLPIFALEAQEGRLFHPLALTKTLVMFAATMLSITLIPVLMLFFIRGRIRKEQANPLNRFIIKLYKPILRWVLHHRLIVLVAGLLLVGSIYPIYMQLEGEFMPPLYEESFMYMPVTIPNISMEQARQLVIWQNQILKQQFPEVRSVFGKVGRADTPTDPAPVSMIETIIQLKPRSEWRDGMTVSRLTEEMDAAIKVAGLTNSWTMPIVGRIDMLSTGIRTTLGLKLFGDDIPTLEHLGKQVEEVLKTVPGANSVYAERVGSGGSYLDIQVRRDQIDRYGLTVEDVLLFVDQAIGGKTVDELYAGRARYPIQVRYARNTRTDLEAIKSLLIPIDGGYHIQLQDVADIQTQRGPAMIRSEGGELTTYVFVYVKERSIASFIQEAEPLIHKVFEDNMGYTFKWSGQYEYMERANQRLMVIVPITLLIIFVLLFLNFRRLILPLIVLLTIPFALIGGFVLIYLLNYHLSVASWIGFIALAGVAAETGVVMIVFLEDAVNRYREQNNLHTQTDLIHAIMEGAVQRVRPKLMTVLSTILALLPIFWGIGVGSEVLRRIAAPMLGGLISSAILTLLVIPVLYMSWKQAQLGYHSFKRRYERNRAT